MGWCKGAAGAATPPPTHTLRTPPANDSQRKAYSRTTRDRAAPRIMTSCRAGASPPVPTPVSRQSPRSEEYVMADRDPYIVRRLADERATDLLAAADRQRLIDNRASRLRRTAGLALVRLGEALVGGGTGPASPLRPVGVAR